MPLLLSLLFLQGFNSCSSSDDDDTNIFLTAWLAETKFTNQGDGTVVDVDGRMWTKCSYGQVWNSSLDDCTGDTTGGATTYGANSMYYCELADLCTDYSTGLANDGPAWDACDQLSFAGYTDWRLPTKYELALITDNVSYESFLSSFPETPDDKPFWSGSNNESSSGGTAAAWGVVFSESQFGNEVSRTKEQSNLYVRCVRDP